MKTLIALICAAFMLVGCAGPVRNFQTVSGTVQWHKGTLPEVQKQCVEGKLRGSDIFQIRACYKMTDDGVCHIYAQDGEQNFAYLGHELKHCFDGYFHDNNGKWVDSDKK